MVVLGLLHAAVASADLEHAALAPPDGWTAQPVPAENLEEPREATGMLRAAGTVWASPDGDGELVVLELVQRRSGADVRAQILGFECGLRASFQVLSIGHRDRVLREARARHAAPAARQARWPSM